MSARKPTKEETDKLKAVMPQPLLSREAVVPNFPKSFL